MNRGRSEEDSSAFVVYRIVGNGKHGVAKSHIRTRQRHFGGVQGRRCCDHTLLNVGHIKC